eukprot:1349844-Rhodomonas_salina.1
MPRCSPGCGRNLKNAPPCQRGIPSNVQVAQLHLEHQQRQHRRWHAGWKSLAPSKLEISTFRRVLCANQRALRLTY